MNPQPRLFNIILIILCLVFFWSYVQARGEPEIKEILGVAKQGPKAILTIQYGQAPTGFAKGDYYILRVIRVGDTFVDYGFCRLEVGEVE